jgi:glycosyltransferase involved in cell wall biosynthesis
MAAQKLHVVIPAYGSSPFLESAIESAMSSVGADTPISVLDDASPTDEIRNITNRFSNRVGYIRNESNLGLAANFLNSFRVSDAEFTVVLGSDDQMLPGYEAQLIEALTQFPNASVVHPYIEVIDGIGNSVLPLVDRIKRSIRGESVNAMEISSENLCRKLFIGNFMYFPATAWRTDVMKLANWNTTYKHAVDMDLLFKLALLGEQFVFTNDRVFQYRRHADSVSSVLANEDTRLSEELAVHWTALSLLPASARFSTKLLAQLAPTVRIHALIIGLKQVPKSPLKGLRHLARSLMPIRPLP